MIFDVGGEALLGGIQGWTFGDGPADEDAVHFQAEVVMEPRRPVLLDDEAVLPAGLRRAFGLGRLAEIAFALVLGERTRHRIQFDSLLSFGQVPSNGVPANTWRSWCVGGFRRYRGYRG